MLFNFQLSLIGQLRTRAIKELDAIVPIRIVGSADDDAKIRFEFLCEPCDSRRWQRADQQDIGTRRDKSGLQR